MNAPLTRRTLLGATVAVGTVVLPAIAEAAFPAVPDAGPDADLFDLLRQYAEAEAAMWNASHVSEPAWKTALGSYPPRPEALRWRPNDFPRTSYGRGISNSEGDDDTRHYGERGVGWLRDREPFPIWAARVNAAMTAEEAQVCETRRLEILAAWDGRQADRRAVDDLVGYTAAVEAEDAAADLVHTLVCTIKRARPRTMAGLQALAEWVRGQAEADEAHDDLLGLFADTVAAFGTTVS